MTGAIHSTRIASSLAGAGLLAVAAAGLPGCTDRAEKAGRQTPELQSPFGVPFVYGHLPQRGPSQRDAQRQIRFDPKYYTVVYLKFGSGKYLLSKHAYFETDSNPDKVECSFKYLRDGTSPTNCSPYQAGGKGPIFYDFADFNFGRQQRVYVFVDNVDVGFNPKSPLSFTPFGAFDPPNVSGPVTRHPNQSFYNAKLASFWKEASGNDGPVGLYFENYFRGKDGKEINDTSNNNAKFSINFNLSVCRTGGSTCSFGDDKQVIPLTIDPDTGNGFGNKP